MARDPKGSRRGPGNRISKATSRARGSRVGSPYCYIPPRTGSHSTLFVRAPHSKASGRLQRPVPLLQVRDVQSGASVSCPSYRNQCGILRVTSDHLPTVSHNVMHRTTSFLILKFLLSIRGEPSKSIAPNLKSRKTRFAFSQRVPYRTGQTI